MRGKQATKRKLPKDEVYDSELVSKLINYVMLDGKKFTARKIVYAALEDLGQKAKTDAIAALDQALENIKPTVEVRARRVGGANYQVPMPVAENRQTSLAFRWLVDVIRKNRGSKETWEVLAQELLAAYNGEGSVVNKKEEVERMAQANKAFAHFAN